MFSRNKFLGVLSLDLCCPLIQDANGSLSFQRGDDVTVIDNDTIDLILDSVQSVLESFESRR